MQLLIHPSHSMHLLIVMSHPSVFSISSLRRCGFFALTAGMLGMITATSHRDTNDFRDFQVILFGAFQDGSGIQKHDNSWIVGVCFSVFLSLPPTKSVQNHHWFFGLFFWHGTCEWSGNRCPTWCHDHTKWWTYLFIQNPIMSNPSKKRTDVSHQRCLPVAFPRPRFLLLEKEEVILDEQLQQRRDVFDGAGG